MTSKFSKEATIITAIQGVVDNVRDGMSPTDAVIKVAEEEKLSRNFVDMVCMGYNTGATNHQRESESNVLSKYADFPLAEAEKVAEVLWSAEVKTPAEIKAASVVSDQYSSAPVRKPSLPMATEKVAHVSEPKPLELPAIEKEAHAVNRVRDMRQELLRKRAEASNAKDKLIVALGELGDHFKQARHEFPLWDYAVLAKFGSAGDTICSYIADRNGHKRHNTLPKQASAIDWTTGPYRQAVVCVELAKQASVAARDYAASEEEATKEAGVLLDPFLSSEPNSILLKEDTQKQAGIGSLLGFQAMRSLAKQDQPTPEQQAARMADDLSDPDHDTALRQIQAQTMLQDMLQNDEVISGYDPEEVTTSYNEMAQLSPQSAIQPALVRPWLRKRLTQGAIEPFEAAEMANVEKTISQTNQPGEKVSNVLRRSIIAGS